MVVGARVLGVLVVGWVLVGAGCGNSTSNPASSAAGTASGGGASGSAAGGNAGTGQAGSAVAGGADAGGSATGGTSAGGSSAGMSKLEACLSYVKQFCALDTRCRGQLSSSACEQASDSTCPDVLFSEGSTRTAQGLIDCAAKWATMSCADYAQGKQPDCVTPGLKAVGDKCEFASQCATLACSAPRMGCGVCLVGAEPGGACGATTQCPGAQLCNGTQCQDNTKLNREGIPGAPCDDTHFCNDASYCSAGACAALPTTGASCAATAACASGSFCNPTSHQCVPAPPAGQPCLDDIAHGMVCDGSAYCSNGQCLALPTEGQPCTAPQVGPICALGFWCQAPNTTRVCRAVGSTPDCDADWECATGSVCRDKLCKVEAAFHAACDADHVCSELATCTDGKCEPLETQGLFAKRCP